MANRMKAVAARTFRAPLEVMDLPSPTAGPTELLVRVEFAGMNPLDWKIVDGIYDGKRPHVFPLIAGIDAAGVVEAVGPGTSRYGVGDRVFGQFLHDPVGTGTYAGLAPVPEGVGIARVPSQMSSETAAALPTAGMTALEALEELEVPPEGTLVIVGASGGVGSLATALAASRSIRVIAVARSAAADRLRSAGAEALVDPASADAVDEVRKLRPAGVDGLLDAMSDRVAFARWATVVRKGGTAATTTFSADPASLAAKGVRGINVDLQPNHALLERLAQSVIEHAIPVPVQARVGLAEASAALQNIRAGKASGKTLVDPSR